MIYTNELLLSFHLWQNEMLWNDPAHIVAGVLGATLFLYLNKV
jgi:hypothetical protein